MLFAYTYVPHSIEKMQEFIDFIFFEVWCKAPMTRKFSFSLFNGNTELKDLMEKMYYDHTKIGDFFYSRVEQLFILFSVLDVSYIEMLKELYNANNNIEQACIDKNVEIVRYSDIKKSMKILEIFWKIFFQTCGENLFLEKHQLNLALEQYLTTIMLL